MASVAAKVPLVIVQGSEFSKVLRYMQPQREYRAITNIPKAAPCRITAAGHDLPVGWPFWVESVKGMEQVNRRFPTVEAPDTPPYTATVVDVNTVEINDLNALDFDTYTGSGVIIYQPPYDLTNAQARMQIRKTITDTAIIATLNTENGGIVIDEDLSTITLVQTDVQTAALAFKAAVYDVEVKLSGNGWTRIAYGSVTLSQETTR